MYIFFCVSNKILDSNEYDNGRWKWGGIIRSVSLKLHISSLSTVAWKDLILSLWETEENSLILAISQFTVIEESYSMKMTSELIMNQNYLTECK